MVDNEQNLVNVVSERPFADRPKTQPQPQFQHCSIMVNGLGVAGCFDVVQLPNRLFLSRKWRSSPAKNLEKNTAYLAFFGNIEGAGILIELMFSTEMFAVSHLNFNKHVMSPANLYFFSLE